MLLVGIILCFISALANADFERNKATKLEDLLKCDIVATVQCVENKGEKQFIEKRLLKGEVNDQMRSFLRSATILVDDFPTDYIFASSIDGARTILIMLDAEGRFKIQQDNKSVIMSVDALDDKLNPQAK